MSDYDKKFYLNQAPQSAQAASVLLPKSLSYLRGAGHSVSSIVDVGAGVGAWLAVARNLGLSQILAIEGAWVEKQETLIGKENYFFHDLTLPLTLDRKFDLAISLEVAEHLAGDMGEQFVESITTLSDVVLFSAAVPRQGGTNHVNEQWPSYWAQIFRSRGYAAWDGLRLSIWHDPAVPFYYRQNAVLYIRTTRSELLHALRTMAYQNFMPDLPIDCVHPVNFEYLMRNADIPTLGHILRALPRSFARSLCTRWRRAG